MTLFNKEDKKTSVIERISLWWRFDGRHIPSNIIQGIKNIIYWFPIIWKDMITEIPKEQVPEGVQVGETLQGNGPMGPINVRVVEVKDDVVVLDANHPLAGQKLIFDLEVVSVG